MMRSSLHAITEDSTGRVLEWGGCPLRAAVAGETAHVGTIAASSQSIIDGAKPLYTTVVANAFVEMTQAEKDVVDAIVNLDAYDYGEVAGGFGLDLAKGFDQTVTLIGSLGPDDAIEVLTPRRGTRHMTLLIRQDEVGGHQIDPEAWSTVVRWGSKGPPVFGDPKDTERFVNFHYRGDYGEVCAHYEDNVHPIPERRRIARQFLKESNRSR